MFTKKPGGVPSGNSVRKASGRKTDKAKQKLNRNKFYQHL